MNSRHLSGALFATSLAVTAAGLILRFSDLTVSTPAEDFGFPGFGSVFVISYATVGWLVGG